MAHYFCSILMKLTFARDFRKTLEFHETSSSENRVVPFGRKDTQTDAQTDRQTNKYTDITKLIVAFRNFSIARKDT
jgi:hypothetical protein